MPHAPETLKAASDYAEYRDRPTAVKSDFLAGYDYRQKEIDKLIVAVRKMNEYIRNREDYPDLEEQILKASDELIQNYKR